MTGVREAKKVRTRMAIARAAAAIARFEGIEHLSIAHISERAGVSTRTFHNYFNSKEEAILAFTMASVDDLLESVGHVEAANAIDAVEEATINAMRSGKDELMSLYTLKVLSQDLGFLLAGMNSEMDRQLQDKVYGFFKECFPELDPFELAAQLTIGIGTAQFAFSYFFENARDQPSEVGVEIIRRAFDQVRHHG